MNKSEENKMHLVEEDRNQTITQDEYAVLNKAALEFIQTGKIERKCPRCGESLVFELIDSIEIIHCQNPQCVKTIRRGI